MKRTNERTNESQGAAGPRVEMKIRSKALASKSFNSWRGWRKAIGNTEKNVGRPWEDHGKYMGNIWEIWEIRGKINDLMIYNMVLHVFLMDIFMGY